MRIVDFDADHLEHAAQIAKQNYEEERGYVPALPPSNKMPDLNSFAEAARGVAAVDGGELLGFFCWLTPWDNHFGVSKGTWSPVHAHGAVRQNRAEIYDRLYQSAAEKLVAEGVFSHSVTLYEHDIRANESFSQNGFGRRCADAIRETAPIPASSFANIIFRQAGVQDAEAIAEMRNSTGIHLSKTPTFIPFSNSVTLTDIINGIANGECQYFIASEQNRPVAYFRIQKTGENFACDDISMMNISGAYSLPEVRGRGISAGLLSWIITWLRERGYSRCGVDYECFNPAARKFWLKYFAAYTNSVVRRIDERICLK